MEPFYYSQYIANNTQCIQKNSLVIFCNKFLGLWINVSPLLFILTVKIVCPTFALIELMGILITRLLYSFEVIVVG